MFYYFEEKTNIKMAQDRNILNILPQLVSKGLFNESVSAMDIFDLDYFENRIQELQSAFFEDFITHTLALKANPIRGSDQWIIILTLKA